MAQTLPEKARKFAIRAHGNQKYGDNPYSYHLDAVAAIAKPFGEAYEVTAFLHDVLEDTKTEAAEILSKFGEEVAGAVFFLTDPEGANRKERKTKLHNRLASLSIESGHRANRNKMVLIVKACDRLANVRECSKNNPNLFKMYYSEHEEFHKAVYRAGLCDNVWEEIDVLLETT